MPTNKSVAVAVVGPATLVVDALIGKLVLPIVGYGATAASAGSFGMVAAVCAVGGVIGCVAALILFGIVDCVIDQKTRPNTNFMLKSLIGLGSIVGAIFIGSLIFGAMANPIALSVLAGTITGVVGGLALAALVTTAGGIGACICGAKKHVPVIFTP